jgi:hypothetical protein
MASSTKANKHQDHSTLIETEREIKKETETETIPIIKK